MFRYYNNEIITLDLPLQNRTLLFSVYLFRKTWILNTHVYEFIDSLKGLNHINVSKRLRIYFHALRESITTQTYNNILIKPI